jgi:hypothetical protein
MYQAIEGVSWLTERTLAVVSDRAAHSSRPAAHPTEQAIHIVALPA